MSAFTDVVKAYSWEAYVAPPMNPFGPTIPRVDNYSRSVELARSPSGYTQLQTDGSNVYSYIVRANGVTFYWVPSEIRVGAGAAYKINPAKASAIGGVPFKRAVKHVATGSWGGNVNEGWTGEDGYAFFSNPGEVRDLTDYVEWKSGSFWRDQGLGILGVVAAPLIVSSLVPGVATAATSAAPSTASASLAAVPEAAPLSFPSVTFSGAGAVSTPVASIAAPTTNALGLSSVASTVAAPSNVLGISLPTVSTVAAPVAQTVTAAAIVPAAESTVATGIAASIKAAGSQLTSALSTVKAGAGAVSSTVAAGSAVKTLASAIDDSKKSDSVVGSGDLAAIAELEAAAARATLQAPAITVTGSFPWELYAAFAALAYVAFKG